MGQDPPIEPPAPPPSAPPSSAEAPPAPSSSGPPAWIRPFEKALLVIAVIAVGILSLVGIVLIVGEVNLGEMGRLLAVLAFVAVFALTAVAALIPIRRGAAMGWVGLVASGLALLLSIALVLSTFPDPTLAKLFTVVATLAWNLAFVALLAALLGRHSAVDAFAWGTIGMLALSFFLSLIQLFAEIRSEGYVKLTIIVGILGGFGLIATPALARALAPREAGAERLVVVDTYPAG